MTTKTHYESNDGSTTDATIAHYGRKGMKWGVRRTAAQLGTRVKKGAKTFHKEAAKQHKEDILKSHARDKKILKKIGLNKLANELPEPNTELPGSGTGRAIKRGAKRLKANREAVAAEGAANRKAVADAVKKGAKGLKANREAVAAEGAANRKAVADAGKRVASGMGSKVKKAGTWANNNPEKALSAGLFLGAVVSAGVNQKVFGTPLPQYKYR